MSVKNLTRYVPGLYVNENGETSLSFAVIFSIGMCILAIVAVPFLDKTSREYAETKKYGIDATTTASVGENDKKKSYIMRRSILEDGLTKICRSADKDYC